MKLVCVTIWTAASFEVSGLPNSGAQSVPVLITSLASSPSERKA